MREFPYPVPTPYREKNTLFLSSDGIWLRPYPVFSIKFKAFWARVGPIIALGTALAIFNNPGTFDAMSTSRFVALMVALVVVAVLLQAPGPLVNYLDKKRFREALAAGSAAQAPERFISLESFPDCNVAKVGPDASTGPTVNFTSADQYLILEFSEREYRELETVCSSFYGAGAPQLPSPEDPGMGLGD